jgi:WD40 repeat protein
MVSKQIEKVYREPFLSTGGVSFNTNDSMLATGNSNGDVVVRNLQNPEGAPVPKRLDLTQSHESGISEVILSSYSSEQDKAEVTQVRFSVVKRHILASAYKNGQVVIWDVQGIFTKAQTTGLSQACKKFVFAAHDGRPCTGIAFSQVNHLLLASCGVDAKVHFYDITQGKEVKKIDVNQNSSSNQSPNQIVTLAKQE